MDGQASHGYCPTHHAEVLAEFEAFAGNGYVALDIVAEACGLTEHALHHQFRPDDWAVPRDWRFDGHATLYREAALPALARELLSRGLTGASERLLAWLAARGNQPAAKLWFQEGAMA